MEPLRFSFGVRIFRGKGRTSLNGENYDGPSGNRGNLVIDSFPFGCFEHSLSISPCSERFSDFRRSILERRKSLKVTLTEAFLSNLTMQLCNSVIFSCEISIAHNVGKLLKCTGFPFSRL